MKYLIQFTLDSEDVCLIPSTVSEFKIVDSRSAGIDLNLLEGEDDGISIPIMNIVITFLLITLFIYLALKCSFNF